MDREEELKGLLSYAKRTAVRDHERKLLRYLAALVLTGAAAKYAGDVVAWWTGLFN